ncbi:MAG: CPBP family intramembrane metalloprotease [Anaerolineae bacterium]|nr:CPBP family intramembrane metalloprotease [Anaerolineae bacterium]
MSEQTHDNRGSVRNIIIFVVIVIAFGWIGYFLAQDGTEESRQLGLLLFIIAPVVAMVLLRLLFGDGWKDLGLGPHFKGNWFWYLASILIYPLVVGVVLLIGVAVGAISLTGKSFGAYLAVFGAQLGAVLLKNIFEEFGWRGYLTPRLDSMGVKPLTNHLITGTIWGVWHVPYWLALLTPEEISSMTPRSMSLFIPMAIVGIIASAIIFGEIRLATGSVWPTWIMHNIDNAVVVALLTGGFITINRGEFWLTPGMDGVLHIVLIVAVGMWAFRRRKKG